MLYVHVMRLTVEAAVRYRIQWSVGITTGEAKLKYKALERIPKKIYKDFEPLAVNDEIAMLVSIGLQ